MPNERTKIMSKRILGLAALVCAVLLVSTVSAGSRHPARHSTPSHQATRAQPRLHRASRVRTQHVRTQRARSHARRAPVRVRRGVRLMRPARVATQTRRARPAASSRAAAQRTRAATRQARKITPTKIRNWVRCAELADNCGSLGK